MYTSIKAIILNLFLYSLISIKVWSGISHFRSDIDEYEEIVGLHLLVVENRRKSDRNSTTASTMILTWSNPGLNTRLHHINPLFKLPDLCHGDVTIMVLVLRLYSIVFHIDVSYIKFYIYGFQM
jgi:hypothetical protein